VRRGPEFGCELAGVDVTLVGDAENVREIEKILRQSGWELARIVGSHRQYVHPGNPTW
jgi:hypothetical protein